MSKILFWVPGAKPLRSSNDFCQKIIFWIYKNCFNFCPVYEENDWEKYFGSSEYRVQKITWSGRVTPKEISRARDKLTALMRKQPGQEFYFLTESLGTEIALRAIEANPKAQVKVMVAMCPVHAPRVIQRFVMVIIQSQSDFFARFANWVLWLPSSWRKTTGNVLVQDLKIRHDQFRPNQNVTVHNKPKKLLTLVKDYLNKKRI